MTNRSGSGLALVRIAFGLYFLGSAFKKTTGQWFVDGGPVTEFVQKNLPQATAFYRPFLESTVLPNADLFADLVTLGEWVVGFSLLLGLFTRLGGLLSVLLVGNFLLTKGVTSLTGGGAISTDILFFAAGIGCAIGAAGLVWGLDGALRRQFAGNPITRWLAGIPAREATTLAEPATFVARRERPVDRRAS